MSEETTTSSPAHLPGDIVWVKISTTSNKECWWPGEVVDFESLSDEIRESFDEKRTPPLVTVAFFGETSYEFIKDNEHVYAYNCPKKDEFITRGLDAYRRSKSFMEKFPKDVRTAETKTNGNVNILDDPKYHHTQQKFNYNLIFSSGTKKTEKRKSLKSSASSGNSPQKSASKRRVVNITHPRFLGLDDDCQVRVLVQQPMTKDPDEEEKRYTCPKCDYVTSRIDVFVFHSNSHGAKTSSPKVGKIVKRLPNKRVSKIKIPPSRTTTIDEDLALLKQGLSLSCGESSFEEEEEDDDVENRPRPKQKRKMKTSDKPKGKKKKVEKEVAVEKKTDVHELTAEWEEEDEEEEEKVEGEADKASTSKLDDAPESAVKKDAADDTCFDFNEDEEDKIMTPSTPASGRKIPRVIPEKRKSFEPTDEPVVATDDPDVPKPTEDTKLVEDAKPVNDTELVEDTKSVDDAKPAEDSKPADDTKSVDDEDIEASFNEILEATKLPEIPQSLKCEQNFHNDRSIKFPDKRRESSPPLPAQEPEPSKSEPTKLINIKKRFVRSFEEMERKELEAKNDDSSKESETVAVEEPKIVQNEEEAEKANVVVDDDGGSLLSNGKETVESPKAAKTPEVIEKIVERQDIATSKDVNEEKLDDCNNISYDINTDVISNVAIEEKKAECVEEAPAEAENANIVEVAKEAEPVKPKWKSRLLSVDREEVEDKSNKSSKTKAKYRKQLKEDPAGETMEDVTSKPMEHTTSKSIEHITSKSMDHITSKSMEHITSKPMEHITSKSVEHITSKPEEHITSKPEEHITSKPEEHITSKPEEHITSKPEEHITSKPEEHITSKPEEHITSKPEEHITSKPEEHITSKPEEHITSKPEYVDDKSNKSSKTKSKYRKQLKDDDADEPMEDITTKPMEERITSKLEYVDDKLNMSSKSKGKYRKELKADDTDEPMKHVTTKPMEKHISLKLENADNRSSKSKGKYRKQLKEDESDELIENTTSKLMEEHITSKPMEEHITSKPMEEHITSKTTEHITSKPMDEHIISKTTEHITPKLIEHITSKEEEKEDYFEERYVGDKSNRSSKTKGKHRKQLKEDDDNEPMEHITSTPMEERITSKRTEHITPELIEHITAKEEEKEGYFEERYVGDKSNKSSKTKGKHRKQLKEDDDNEPMEHITSTPIEHIRSKPTEEHITSKVTKHITSKPMEEHIISKTMEPITAKPMKHVTLKEKEKEDRFEERYSKKRRASLRKSVEAATTDVKKELKVSKLKTQLMSKLSEGEAAASAIAERRSRSRSRSDTESEPTPKKLRRISQQFDEIVIEKSVDKVEVTVNKEDTVEPHDVVVEAVQEVEVKEVSIQEVMIPEVMEETYVAEEVTVEKTEEAPSALDTLATVSDKIQAPSVPEINIEKNLTVVSESDLGDKEVEIAKVPIVEEGTVKATMVAGFSVDFASNDDRDIKDGVLAAAAGVCEEIESPQFEVHVSEMASAVKVEAEVHDIQVKQESIVEVKKEEEVPNNSVEVQMAHLTNTSMETPMKQDAHETTTSKKLLEILTEPKTKRPTPKAGSSSSSVTMQLKIKNPKFDLVEQNVVKPKSKAGKVVVRSSIPGSHLKTTVIHESPSASPSEITVQKVPPKSDDIEDIARYIIQKPVKSIAEEDSDEKVPPPAPPPVKKPAVKSKPKILDNTIIKPPNKELVQKAHGSGDDNVFDIDSMPIVLSDQILTPETIENMPIVLQESTTSAPSTSEKPVPHIRKVPQPQLKLVGKSSPVVKESPTRGPPGKTYSKVVKQGGKVYQASGTTLLKTNPAMLGQAKQSKFVIVSSETTTTPTGSGKYVIGKRIVKRTPGTLTPSPSSGKAESSGNKIMIVTNHKGQQQMVLAPTQKIVGYQTAKKVPTLRGSTVVPGSKGTNIISQTIINPKGQITTTSPFASAKKMKVDPSKGRLLGPKVIVQGQGGGSRSAGQPRTIIIRNPQGQTVKKIHTDEALLDQQVQEQLDAIKRSTYGQNTVKVPVKKYASKKINESTKTALQTKTVQQMGGSTSSAKANVPPLAPISPPKKAEPKVEKVEKQLEQKRAPHQLVIQDALGNQTTITEGQILALPSETVDGQPQSYMLVTLDETGNLTPLNNEALMSLDPNICGDLSNMVLHVDQGAVSAEAKPSEPSPPPPKVEEPPAKEEPAAVVVEEKPQEEVAATGEANAVQAVACAINNGETNQQLIITGDPVSTQKFLESLTEGNADLANLLANAEGNILIHADGQQILINTDADNQMLMAVNSETPAAESGESAGNPILPHNFNAPKNQDILAAALADTDVFQQEQAVVPSSKVTQQSQLSPGSALYPINVNNVLETSSMSSPIMTPLEVPSSNGKKIECDVLSAVPKNVDLPITITDPNISQTVSQQQVALNELHANLELPLGIQDVTVTSAEMASPSFGYLDDSVDKSFPSSISMPLLTEEPEDVVTTSSVHSLPSEIIEKKSEPQSLIKQYLLATTGMPTISTQMCSSLSEPPPDMFDFTIDQEKPADDKQESSSTDLNSPSAASTDSCEIPVQPEIVARSSPPDHVVGESSSPPPPTSEL